MNKKAAPTTLTSSLRAVSLLGQRVDHGCYFWHPPLLRADDGHLCYATAPTLHSKQSKEVNPQRKTTFLAPATLRTHQASDKCVVGYKVK